VRDSSVVIPEPAFRNSGLWADERPLGAVQTGWLHHQRSQPLHRPTWIQAIQSNENRAMIGPRSVLPLLPAARSNEASFYIRFIEAFFSTVAFAAGMKAA
jgi:hypothetical protein